MEWLFHLDASLLLWIQENLRVSWLTPFFKQITKLGNVGWFWIFLTVILLLIPKQRRTAVVSISKNTESSANKAFVRVSVLSKFNSLCQVCIVFLSSCLSWKYSTIFCFFYKYFFRVFFSVQGKLT